MKGSGRPELGTALVTTAMFRMAGQKMMATIPTARNRP